MTVTNSLLSDFNEKYKFLINSIKDVIIETELDGIFTYVSPQVYELFGYRPDELLGVELLQFIHHDDLPTITESLSQIINSEEVFSLEYRVKHKAGHFIPVAAHGSLVKSGDNTRLVCILRDITQQRKIEKQFVEINSLKSELLERTSHELKSPLISIKGFTDLLLKLHRDKFDDESYTILGEIKQGVERLEIIINKLLETSHLDSGQIQFKPTREDLSFLIKFCTRNLRGLAATRNHFINLNLHDKIILNFEKEKLYEVISHLIINALKFTPPYGEIQIQSDYRDDCVVISVKDNGIGFTKDEKKKIFKKFGKIERYGQGWNIRIEGTGMGLYTSKKIIELHGGEIWVESLGRNKGSKFSFSLPLIKE